MMRRLLEATMKIEESTRSRIGIQNSDGTITSIYCHWDGYPDGVGKTLQRSYTSPSKVKELLALGDISALESNPANIEAFKDRGDTGVDARTSKDEKAFLSLTKRTWGEYAYLFKNGKWQTFDLYNQGDDEE